MSENEFEFDPVSMSLSGSRACLQRSEFGLKEAQSSLQETMHRLRESRLLVSSSDELIRRMLLARSEDAGGGTSVQTADRQAY